MVAKAGGAVGGGAVGHAGGGGGWGRLVAELVGHGVGVADVLGAADAGFSHVVRFAGHLGSVLDIGSGGGRAKLEDGGLPVVALESELLVFCGFRRDAAWKVDVGEDRVLLGDGHVDLRLASPIRSLLCLLLALQKLLLDGLHIAVVNIGRIFGILDDLLLSTINFLLDLVGVSIKLVDLILDGFLGGLLESWAESLQQNWLSKSEQELVLGLCELDAEILDVNLEEITVSVDLMAF